MGFNFQSAFNQDIWGKKNQFIAGGGYDLALTRLKQTEQLNDIDDGDPAGDQVTGRTWFDNRRMPINLSNEIETEVNLGGRARTMSLFATDTLSLSQSWHLTASSRYNHTQVTNRDHITATGSSASLSGDHHFSRVNPSLGITYTPNDQLSVFGSYSESSRAPTSIELGCANPAVPCKLPNAMAGDPPLNQVVAKTYETGLRGKLTETFKWNTSIYRTMNHDDIHFIQSSTIGSLGYFDNVGRTKRQGFDLGLTGVIDKLFLRAGYSFVSAKYDSDLTLINEVNSTAGEDDGEFQVRKGNYLAGIPKHQFKLRAQYEVLPKWTVGTNVVYYSDQFVHGNDNNSHVSGALTPGKLSGYTVVNLDTQVDVGQGWKVFAKAINIFDKDYYSAGRFGETYFSSSGSWNGTDAGERSLTSVVPGAPRAGWIGVRYEFGGAPEAK